MDAVRFDRLARWVGDPSSRRAVLGSALGSMVVGWLGLAETAGKKRKKRHKRKNKRKNRKKKGCKPPCSECQRCKKGKRKGTCLPTSGAACGNGGVCESGSCVCPSGTETCGGACVDLLTNDAHCGACDTPCPSGERCLHGTCTCDPLDNTCPTSADGQCGCSSVQADVFTAACTDRNSACDLDRPCQTSDDCPPRSVCLLGCADPPAPNPRRCSTPCDPL